MGRRPTRSATRAPTEIDEIGIMRALRLAGERALRQLPEQPDLVLLDGNHDWLTKPARSDQPACSTTPDAEERGRSAAGDDHDQGGHEVRVGGRGERAGQGRSGTD